MSECKVCMSSFRYQVESKYGNGVPARVIEAWLLLNNVKISHTTILHHMKEHASGKRNLFKPQSIKAAGFKNAIDPFESTEAHNERVLREKYERDGATDAEIAEGAITAAKEAKALKDSNTKMLAAFERQGKRQQEAEAYEAWKAKNEDKFKAMYVEDTEHGNHKAKGGESLK